MSLSTSKTTSLCRSCPKLCNTACPVARVEQQESATPWGKMSAMNALDAKILPFRSDTLALAYKCLNCKASEPACEFENPVSATLNTYRVKAYRAGMAPPAIYSYIQRFEKEANPFGRDLHRILQKNFPQKAFAKKPFVYFPGCTEIAKDGAVTKKILHACPDLSLYDGSFPCCGYPLFAAGDWEGFRELAEMNRKAFEEYSLVVTGAPACLYTLETLYRSAGYPIGTRFLHLAEYWDRKKEARPRPKKKFPSIAYHDPCYLGRYRSVYDAPRRLLTAATGSPPIELARMKQHSSCCGAGGLLPITYPETARAITQERVLEFRRTGADLLVTSCPTCVDRFRQFGVPCRSLGDFLGEVNV